MSDYTCDKCGELKWRTEHKCPPIFKVRWPDICGPDDWAEFRAIDAETAAEKWAELHDQESADYRIVGQHSTPQVEVKAEDGTLTRWEVKGEAVATYYAKEIATVGDGGSK